MSSDADETNGIKMGLDKEKKRQRQVSGKVKVARKPGRCEFASKTTAMSLVSWRTGMT